MTQGNMPNIQRAFPLLCIVMFIAATIPAVDAAYMLSKARLAQSLIERSWHRTGNTPWPWADTRPVARLTIPRLSIDSFVLDGATGAALAFGPGMVSGSSAPGTPGVTMIAAHRDTHFKALRNIKTDDVINVQDSDRQWHRYRVSHIGIADSRKETIIASTDRARTVLVTCYPFDAVRPGGPLRFVVEAVLEN